MSLLNINHPLTVLKPLKTSNKIKIGKILSL
jgi:hypothetical protein